MNEEELAQSAYLGHRYDFAQMLLGQRPNFPSEIANNGMGQRSRHARMRHSYVKSLKLPAGGKFFSFHYHQRSCWITTGGSGSAADFIRYLPLALGSNTDTVLFL